MAGTRDKRQPVILLLACLVAVNVALAGYLLWPGAGNQSTRTQQEEQLRQELRTRSHEVAPLRGMDQKLLKDRDDFQVFYRENIPSRWSQISERVEKLAQETGVAKQAISYAPESTELPNVQRVKINTTVAGDYFRIARFVNALERDKMFFVIDQVALSGQKEGTVAVQIRFETYLKETA